MSTRKQKWFFLRGLVREAGHWSGFLERFEAAFPDREAIALEIPGNGSRFRETSPASIPEMLEAVRERYLPRRGEENHLFALSLGAMIGMEWMRQHPGDFKNAVLVNTSLRGLSPFYHRLRPWNYPRILYMALFGKPEAVERNILAMTSNQTARHGELTVAWTKIHEQRPVSLTNAARQIIAAATYRPSHEKPGIPVLLLNGGNDRLVHPKCSQAIAKHWGLKLAVHPTAGHDLTLDEPQWVVEHLRTC